ncbi:MAG: DUF370 domain-containing protein [Clostridiales bacterium]|nr:DUF370 domain-containing protein [Clostridiales bacterium]
MYVHIGGEYTILSKSIVGLINLETVPASSSDMNSFLKISEEDNILEYVSEEIPRSIVITGDRVYVSPLSVSTLNKRIRTSNIVTDP